jgi:hypothetical protein
MKESTIQNYLLPAPRLEKVQNNDDSNVQVFRNTKPGDLSKSQTYRPAQDAWKYSKKLEDEPKYVQYIPS